MSKLHWFERLRALAQRTQPGGEGVVEGLVLSGGGARGSFEIGALTYLYDQVGIAPQSMVATSSGSIIASMLAQSADRDQQRAALRTLESYWMAMTDPSQMFAEQAWFTRMRQRWEDIAPAIPERGDPGPTVVDAQADADAERLVKQALEYDPSDEADDFSWSAVWQLLGVLGRIGRAGPDLASSLRGAERAASAYRPGPIVGQLLFESGFSSQAVRDSGVELRLAFVGLNGGQLRFMRQDGIIVDDEDTPVADTPIDLALGVWASCAIPGVFRPVKLGDEVYVDGGVRENVPVEMAVTRLGVTKPYVVVATPPGLAPADYTTKDVVSIILRSVAILLDESVRDEVAWARRAGAVVIAPQVDVHGALQVDPPLLRLNRDYGWMRAAEEVTGAEGRSADIVRARLALLELQRAGAAPAEVAAARVSLRDQLASTDPTLLPSDWPNWPFETAA